ncbi:hypothetical protein GF395_04370 [Candidatus Uhrbacteria bacterium]|nr:hypothetical protein [Candidatus Uhrbacteria bacterium]
MKKCNFTQMTSDRLIEELTSRDWDYGQLKIFLRQYTEEQCAKALARHERKMSAKRAEFRKRKQKLLEADFKEFLHGMEDYIFENGKRLKYGDDWLDKIGYAGEEK